MTICGIVAACVKGSAGVCMPCIKEVGNSCNDVIIAGMICVTILLLAIIVASVYLIQKSIERKASQTSVKNACEAEYISRLLKHLEGLTVKDDVGKYDEKGSQRYIRELKHLIKTGEVADEK